MSFSENIRHPFRRLAGEAGLAREGLRFLAGWQALRMPPGIGDQLLASAIFRELALRQKPRLAMVTDYPDLFLHNPAVPCCLMSSTRILRDARRAEKLMTVAYERYNPQTDTCRFTHQHMIAEICAQAGLTGSVQLRPWFYLQKPELAAGRTRAGCIVVQSNGRGARFPILNKEWVDGRFQEVVDRLQGVASLVQFGSVEEPLLAGVEDLRGQTTLRESAAILANASLFVGQVGFLMHLARSVDCPSVIVYGGREDPRLTGYVCNRNLTRTPPCSPCWRHHTCEWDRMCLSEITANEVVAAVREALAQPAPRPLAVATQVIEPSRLDDAVAPELNACR